MQSLFQQNIGLTFRLVVIGVLCLILMTIDHRNDTLQGFRSTVGSYLVYPMQYIVALPSRLLDRTGESLASQQSLREENARLQDENLQLRAQQLKLLSLQQENSRLRELLRASSRVGEDVLIAEVVRVDQDYYKQQILINKGKAHHVYLGQPVIDAKGIMGQVVELYQHSARVLLISDPSHAMPVQSNRNGVRTIVQGKGNPNELDLLHIPNNTDLRPGDLFISSGLAGRFPPNYPVAVIQEVVIQPGQPFAKVTATPTAELDRSREVLLVWPNQQPE
jgi:rod shape-determining protein MreC